MKTKWGGGGEKGVRGGAGPDGSPSIVFNIYIIYLFK